MITDVRYLTRLSRVPVGLRIVVTVGETVGVEGSSRRVG